MNFRTKILLHIYLPVAAVFILNNLVLLTLETPGHLIVNIIAFGVVVSISLLCLQNFQDKKSKQPEADLLLTTSAEKVEEVYEDLKKLLANSCTKESLPVAKELVRICSKLGPVSADLKEKLETKRPPPFRKGSLRSAYGRQMKKADRSLAGTP